MRKFQGTTKIIKQVLKNHKKSRVYKWNKLYNPRMKSRIAINKEAINNRLRKKSNRMNKS